MKNETYNGWTNYETWLVNLWIDNDCGLYEHMKEIARTSETIRDTADYLREYFEEGNPMNDLEVSFYTDLMQSALDAVNWREIAEGLHENAFNLVVNLDERGEYYATVYDCDGNVVYEIMTADLHELIRDGFLKYVPHEDTDRLCEYLISFDIIPPDSKIYYKR